MRRNILIRIEQIKKEEFNFNDSWWGDTYFSYNNGSNTKLLSNIVFDELTSDDLARAFEFIVMQRCDAMSYRIEKFIKEAKI